MTARGYIEYLFESTHSARVNTSSSIEILLQEIILNTYFNSHHLLRVNISFNGKLSLVLLHYHMLQYWSTCIMYYEGHTTHCRTELIIAATKMK